MAKNKINLKYVKPKREKNKKEVDNKSEIKKDIIAAACILLFIAVVYLGLLLLEKAEVFNEGYEPSTTENEISTDEILIGEVFNRSESEYYVLFENVNDESVSVSTSERLYHVDMSQTFNAKYISESYNENASSVSELQINENTLIKIVDGKIKEYVMGTDSIENYFE